MRRKLGIVMVVLLAAVLLGTVVWAAPSQQADLFQLFVLQARTDLELLANQALGEGLRPDTWTFSTDLTSPTVVVDLWFDNEQLADEIFGTGNRPEGWFGATSSDPELLARNVRHDLELAADAVYGERERPDTWNGAPPIYRCSRTVQNIVHLLNEIYDTRPTTPDSVFDYCAAVQFEIESELLPVIFGTEINAELQLMAWSLRGDLERLADELLGLAQRPPGWIGNLGEDSPTLLPDASTDLEALADVELGVSQRPEEWARFFPNSPAGAYRSLRFNLETLADLTLGAGVRPTGWEADNPIYGCDPLVQVLVFISQERYSFAVDETFADSDRFCELTTFEANNFAESPPEIVVEEEEEDTRFRAESRVAFTYLDVAATQYMGPMPYGVEFRAWYRNFSESNMMFVSGDNFALYIDRRWTTLPEELFVQLPTLDGVRPLAFCDAPWCNGPGPTPTPTGSGPLVALLAGATPAATRDAGQIREQEGKTQVSWNHVRVTYLLDRPEAGTVQVALEICQEPAQIACEPVISVFDNVLGVPKPVLSQSNGLNVYEFRYGYNSDVVIEGATLVSPDVWISDPSIR